MPPSIDLETSVIGCLAMRLSGVLRIAANQQTTRDWWDNHRHCQPSEPYSGSYDFSVVMMPGTHELSDRNPDEHFHAVLEWGG